MPMVLTILGNMDTGRLKKGQVSSRLSQALLALSDLVCRGAITEAQFNKQLELAGFCRARVRRELIVK